MFKSVGAQATESSKTNGPKNFVVPNCGSYLSPSQNPTLLNWKKDYEGLFFFINNSKQFLCCAHSNMQKRKPVPISWHLRENSLPLPLRREQKCKPKAALIKLLFEIPAPLTECTQSYTSRGFAPSWQSRTQLEEKVTLSTVVSVYETVLTAHLQSWQELRVQFCGSLSASKPQLLWDYPQQRPVPVLVQPGSDGQGKHSLEKWTGQKCFGSLGNHTDANAQEEGEACNQQWGEAELWHPWISGSISIGIY